jgi:hypothetical protein
MCNCIKLNVITHESLNSFKTLKFDSNIVKFAKLSCGKIKILGLFGQITIKTSHYFTKLHVITR